MGTRDGALQLPGVHRSASPGEGLPRGSCGPVPREHAGLAGCLRRGHGRDALNLTGAGWLVVTGPRERAASFVEGLDLLANMRMCANVPGQHAVRAAVCGEEGLSGLTVPGGRLYEQSVIASDALNEIPGITCVRPRGALYCFPRLDPAVHPVRDDEALALDILRSQHVLVTHGRGFNWDAPDHFRLTFLPPGPVLTEAIGRLGVYFDAARTGARELP